MNKKVLFCATVDFHFEKFHIPYFKWFKEQGWDVHVAAKGEIPLPFVDEKFSLDIQRSPLSLKNSVAYRELKKIIDDHHYGIIHCHTPMGGVLARLAARHVRGHGTKVIYTAHGFHFYNGAPIKNWLMYYPIEKILAHYTDCLITINQEDYVLATSRHFKAGQINHVHGVGVDTNHFYPIDEQYKNELRRSFGYKPDDFLMFYAAEFNKNKNQQLLIRALSLIKSDVPEARLLLAGSGPLQVDCQTLAKELKVSESIDFLGYKDDIKPYLHISDLAVGSSFREGLPVNIMEAMACGLPIVASDNRGHRELIRDGHNGWIIKSNASIMARKLIQLYENQTLVHHMGSASRKMMNYYSVAQILSELSEIYSNYMLEDSDETQSEYYSSNI